MTFGPPSTTMTEATTAHSTSITEPVEITPLSCTTVPFLTIAFDANFVFKGRDGSPSAPNLQARSAVRSRSHTQVSRSMSSIAQRAWSNLSHSNMPMSETGDWM